MTEEMIVTRRGTFGRFQVTVPMTVKHSMMAWIKNSGMGKAEFLRTALLIGALKLADQVAAKKPNEGFYQADAQASVKEDQK